MKQVHSFLYRKWERIKYFHFAHGKIETLALILRRFAAPLYKSEIGYIMVTNVDLQGQRASLFAGDAEKIKGYDTEIVDSVPTFDSLKNLIPAAFSKKDLKRHITCNPDSSIIFVIKTKGNNKKEIIGYRKISRCHFDDFGIVGDLPRDILYVNYTEVAPEYRGTRVVDIITAATYEYCLREGIRKFFSIVHSYNLSSLKFHRRLKVSKMARRIEAIYLAGRVYKTSISFTDFKDALEQA